MFFDIFIDTAGHIGENWFPMLLVVRYKMIALDKVKKEKLLSYLYFVTAILGEYDAPGKNSSFQT
jgi:hypothetical protein